MYLNKTMAFRISTSGVKPAWLKKKKTKQKLSGNLKKINLLWKTYNSLDFRENGE